MTLPFFVSVAGPAAPTPRGSKVGVGLIEGVAVKTVRLAGFSSAPPITPTEIHRKGDCFEVAGVYAGWHATQVIECRVSRYWAAQLFVGESMGVDNSPRRHRHLPIAILQACSPEPAAMLASLVNLGPEPLMWGFRHGAFALSHGYIIARWYE